MRETITRGMLLLVTLVLAITVASCSSVGEGPGALRTVERSVASEPVSFDTLVSACTDTDGGIDSGEQGTVSVNGTNNTDFCSGNRLVEYFCAENGSIAFTNINCRFGCEDGACKSRTFDTGQPVDAVVNKNGTKAIDGTFDLNRCGDGRVRGSEQCDDGNTIPGDGCDQFCRIENNTNTTFCGDGIVQTPNDNGVFEACDDGNTNSGDGCDSFCMNETINPGNDTNTTNTTIDLFWEGIEFTVQIPNSTNGTNSTNATLFIRASGGQSGVTETTDFFRLATIIRQGSANGPFIASSFETVRTFVNGGYQDFIGPISVPRQEFIFVTSTVDQDDDIEEVNENNNVLTVSRFIE